MTKNMKIGKNGTAFVEQLKPASIADLIALSRQLREEFDMQYYGIVLEELKLRAKARH
jgi:hypothetical protein